MKTSRRRRDVAARLGVDDRRHANVLGALESDRTTVEGGRARWLVIGGRVMDR